jgi:outer membrane translocation and assembly module TamA
MIKQQVTKILLFFLLISMGSCNLYRKIPEGKYLLKENIVMVDSVQNNSEEVHTRILQKPNVMILGYPILADIYMFADQHPDYTYYKWIKKHDKLNGFLQKMISRKQIVQLQRYYKSVNKVVKDIGEPPVYIDTNRIAKSARRLGFYYKSNSYLDVNLNYKIDTVKKYKATVTFDISKQKPYYLKHYEQNIQSPTLATLYKKHKAGSFIKMGKAYNRDDFVNEKERLTKLFKNNGIYHFQPSYINFDLVTDTLNAGHNLEAYLNIPLRTITKNDSVIKKPFLSYSIGKVNIFLSKNKNFSRAKMKDSVQFDQVNIYTENDKLRYRPKILTSSVFFKQGQLYRDIDRLRTHKLLMGLQNFKQAYIEYIENPKDTTLTTNLYLITEKRFKLKGGLDVTHSNIHDVGIKGSASVGVKNIFRGAEVLTAGMSLMTAASKTVSNPDEQFFNVREFGTNLTLTFPRLLLPFGLNKNIPKYMMPKTNLTFLLNTQTNIGLDREKYAGIFGFEWKPKKEKNFAVNLINFEFITNKNAENYFTIYTQSYEKVQDIANSLGDQVTANTASGYINRKIADSSFRTSHPDEYNALKIIKERELRITQNIFIIGNKFNYDFDSRKQPLETEFSLFSFSLEQSGTILSPFSKLFDMPTNEFDQYTINGVPYAEYLKADFTYVKHWQLHKQHILAYRSFFGIAFPYGNSKSIPFVSSYFAGGSNDIRAWRAYTLGPGTTGGPNEFNEANLKFTTNIEYRFPLAGYLKGALFADAGNIWNLKNDETDPRSSFKGFESLRDIALGTGFGLRVDFTYFIIRFDLAFKTYDPSRDIDKRWLIKDWSLYNSVLNLGISYPF